MSRTIHNSVGQEVLIQRLGITGERRERLGIIAIPHKGAAAFKNDLWFVGELEPPVYVLARSSNSLPSFVAV